MAKDVFLFVPAFGQMITSTTFLTTHALRQHLMMKGIGGGISTLSFPDIAELRSMAVTVWYDTMPNSSHILFIDADMGFPPELVSDMLLFDEGVTGTVYPQRKLPLSWAGSGTGAAQTERRGDFMMVEGVGFGCTLIRRDVITTMIEKFPELIDTRLQLHPAGETLRQTGTNRLLRFFEKLDLPERGLVSEDLSFCLRWHQCGGKVWANINHRMSHVGPYDYAGRYLDVVEAMANQPAMTPIQPMSDEQLQQISLIPAEPKPVAPVIIEAAVIATLGQVKGKKPRHKTNAKSARA
jgi:hypothetical protein